MRYGTNKNYHNKQLNVSLFHTLLTRSLTLYITKKIKRIIKTLASFKKRPKKTNFLQNKNPLNKNSVDITIFASKF